MVDYRLPVGESYSLTPTGRAAISYGDNRALLSMNAHSSGPFFAAAGRALAPSGVRRALLSPWMPVGKLTGTLM
jgi:hypothetical protein